jgi:hypothetical protein
LAARKAKGPAGRRRYESNLRNNIEVKNNGCPVPQTGTGCYKVKKHSQNQRRPPTKAGGRYKCKCNAYDNYEIIAV